MTTCSRLRRPALSSICILALLACVAGCASVRRPIPTPPAPRPETPAPPPVAEPSAPAEPRHLASLQLTGQGRILVERGQFDAAIRILERAIALNPRNGENYYYMAEAWLGKGNVTQAAECNRLAVMYLGTTHWQQILAQQRRAIEALGE